jgi:hypothetical protein
MGGLAGMLVLPVTNNIVDARNLAEISQLLDTLHALLNAD